jgi:hypothetical protein
VLKDESDDMVELVVNDKTVLLLDTDDAEFTLAGCDEVALTIPVAIFVVGVSITVTLVALVWCASMRALVFIFFWLLD